MSNTTDDEHGTPERIGAFISGFVLVGGSWFIAILVWSFALDAWRLPLLIIGVVVGGSIGLITGQAVVGAPHRMFGASAMLVPPALAIFAIGLVVWVIRSVF